MDEHDLERELRNERRRERYQNDAEHRARRRAEAEQWKLKNRETYLVQQREYAQVRRSTEEGAEAYKAAQDKHRRANKKERYAATREWHKRNPDYWWQWRNVHIKSWIVKGAKSRAKQNGVPFMLTEADIIIPERCPALGIVLDVAAGRTADNAISLDRVVPELGYVPTNVRIISRRANFIKNNASVEELEAIAAYIRRERG